MEYLIGFLGVVIGYLYLSLRSAEKRAAMASFSLLTTKSRTQQQVDDEAVSTAKKLLALSLDRYKHDGKDK